MKTNLPLTIILSVVINSALLCIVFYAIYNNGFKTPKKGEVWKYSTTETSINPFYDSYTKKSYYFKVLDVQGDYVLYMDIDDSTQYTSYIRFFKIGSKQIK